MINNILASIRKYILAL